jgi:hypothetical protein
MKKAEYKNHVWCWDFTMATSPAPVLSKAVVVELYSAISKPVKAQKYTRCPDSPTSAVNSSVGPDAQ